jgi:hypothetical protein
MHLMYSNSLLLVLSGSVGCSCVFGSLIAQQAAVSLTQYTVRPLQRKSECFKTLCLCCAWLLYSVLSSGLPRHH